MKRLYVRLVLWLIRPGFAWIGIRSAAKESSTFHCLDQALRVRGKTLFPGERVFRVAVDRFSSLNILLERFQERLCLRLGLKAQRSEQCDFQCVDFGTQVCQSTAFGNQIHGHANPVV
ncbi:hypothetical protein C6Q05_16150 [Burkholderia multivorans]|nr:hypothetical protein C6Q05_16150 [Burkholderia multivorans]